MRLATRVGTGAFALVALLALLGGYQLRVIQRLDDAGQRLAASGQAALEQEGALQATVAELRELSLKLALLRDSDYAAELARQRSGFAAQLDELARLSLSAEEGAARERLSEAWRTYAAAASGREAAVTAGGAPEAFRAAVLTDLEAVSAALGDLDQASRGALAATVAANARDAARARWVAGAATAASLLVAASLALGLFLSLDRSLGRLTRATLELAGGNFAHRVPPAGGTELAGLAASFNEMAERLGELDRLKRDFVASVSHDLKAPLAAVREGQRALLDGLAGPLGAEQRRLLELGLQSADRLSLMIRNLLEAARQDAGVPSYRHDPADLVAVVRAASDEMEPLARERRLTLARRLPTSPILVTGDPDALVQLLQNLLSNALRLTPRGGTVGIELEPGPAGEALLEVWDTGPGVPEALKGRLFERFVRGPTGGGSGLGLAICREIVRAHGGQITVEDRPPSGARFRVSLPTCEPAAAPSRAAAQALGAGGG